MRQLEKLTKSFVGLFLPTILFAIICLTGCQKDPVFPDPGIDMSQSQDVMISCDTATTYTMKMKVSTPAGLQALELINANDNSVIKNLSAKYRNQTDFMFEYQIELPEADTILKYNIRIVDAKSKAINQPFEITVRAGKMPIFNIVGGNSKSVISPTFWLEAKMFAGKKQISKYELMDGISVLNKKEFDTPVDECDLEFLCNLKQVKVGEPRKLTLSTFNVDGKKASVDIMVTLNAGNHPIRVVYEGYRSEQEGSHIFHYLYFVYNQDNLVTSVKEDLLSGKTEGPRRISYFTYNDKKMVSEVKIVNGDGSADASSGFTTYKYQYDNDARFVSVSRHDDKDVTDLDTKITALDRDAKGNVISLQKGTTDRWENIQYETVGNETLLIDYIANPLNVQDLTRSHFAGKTSVVWPTYNPALPPFFAEIVDKHFINLFCYKYIYSDRITTHGMGRFAKGESIGKYTHKTDAKGRVTEVKIEKPHLTRPGFWEYDIYTFEYAD